MLCQCADAIRSQAWQAAAKVVQLKLPKGCKPAALFILAWEQPHFGFAPGQSFFQKHVSVLVHSLAFTALHGSVVNAPCALQAD